MNIKKFFDIPDNHYTARQIFRWLWGALQGNRLQAILNATIGLLGVVLGLSSVWAMQRAIDIASGVLDGSLYFAVGLMAVLILGEFAVGISRVWVRNILGVKAQNRMQHCVLARLLRSEWRGREAMHSGDIINRLEQDVKTVVTFLTETLPSTVSTVAMFVGAFVYLLQMDTWLAITTVAILPVFILVSRIYIAYMRKYNRKVRDTDSLIQSLLTETMQHRMLVKTMEADEQMLNRLDVTQQTLRQWVRKRTVFSVASNFFLNLGFSIGFLVAFLWGALRLYAGTLTFGGMTAFLQLVNRIQGPARDLAKLVPAFVSVFTAAERLMELEGIPKEQQGEPCMVSAPCGVRFEHVTFNYGAPGQQPAIKDFSVDFKPGTCTAVMGETGTGKTTLIRLLLALVKPQEGEIKIYSGNGEGKAVANSTLYTLHLVPSIVATSSMCLRAIHCLVAHCARICNWEILRLQTNRCRMRCKWLVPISLMSFLMALIPVSLNRVVDSARVRLSVLPLRVPCFVQAVSCFWMRLPVPLMPIRSVRCWRIYLATTIVRSFLSHIVQPL